ncbi:MAG: type II toxin-antitoxin system HicA family toxin [Candidatus Hydrogenedentota bacterium]
MNSRQQKTLKSVFEVPTRSDILWQKIEALFRALGADVLEGRGSRVRVALRGTRSTYHRPHPGRIASKGAVEAAREQLRKAGLHDDDI